MEARRHEVLKALWQRIEDERYEYFDLVEPPKRRERVKIERRPIAWPTLTPIDVAA